MMKKGILNIYIYIEFFNNHPVYASSKSDDEKLPNQSVIFSSSSNVNQQIEEYHEPEVTNIQNLGIHKDQPKYDRYFDEEEHFFQTPIESLSYDAICDSDTHEKERGEKYSKENFEQQLRLLDQKKAIKSKVNFYIFHDLVADYLESMRKIDIRQFVLKECWFCLHHKLQFGIPCVPSFIKSRVRVYQFLAWIH